MFASVHDLTCSPPPERHALLSEYYLSTIILSECLEQAKKKTFIFNKASLKNSLK